MQPAPSGFQRLGDRLKAWLLKLPAIDWFVAYTAAFNIRRNDVGRWLAIRGLKLMAGRHLSWLTELAGAVAYLYTGVDFIDVKNPRDPGASFFDNPSEAIGNVLRSVTADPNFVELSETMGALVTDPVLGALEKGLENADGDPLEAARAFHGTVASINALGGLTDLAVESITGGQVEGAGRMFQTLYWNLGLGFLGWQTLAPLLSTGLQPKLERHYNRRFRPARFSPSQMADLFALGKADAGTVAETLRDLGWRDQDISLWIDLSYRTLNEGDVWKLYNEGHITKAEAEKRLRALGYNPSDMPLLFKANEKEETAKTRNVLLSTIKSAYREGLISANQARQMLIDQRYSTEEVTLILALLDLQKQNDQLDLTRSEIRTLYSTRVIAKTEAITYLTQAGLDDRQAELLVRAWDEQDSPKPARINQSTIREAFTDGVLTYDAARQKLTELGYSDQDAHIIITTWQTEAKKPTPTPGPTGAGALTLSQLSHMAQAGLITETEMRTRPELARYAPEDRDRLIYLMYSVPTISDVELPQGVLQAAFAHGLLTEDGLLDRLLKRGLSEADARLYIDTLKAELEEEEQAARKATLKKPSVGALQLALQRGIITEEYFAQSLTDMGFTDDVIQMYKLSAQYQAPAKPRNLTTTQILDLYKDGDIIRSEAQYRLVQNGYTVADAQLLLKNIRLTPGDTEVGEAYMLGLMGYEQAYVWFAEHEFSEDEIREFFEGLT